MNFRVAVVLQGAVEWCRAETSADRLLIPNVATVMPRLAMSVGGVRALDARHAVAPERRGTASIPQQARSSEGCFVAHQDGTVICPAVGWIPISLTSGDPSHSRADVKDGAR